MSDSALHTFMWAPRVLLKPHPSVSLYVAIKQLGSSYQLPPLKCVSSAALLMLNDALAVRCTLEKQSKQARNTTKNTQQTGSVWQFYKEQMGTWSWSLRNRWAYAWHWRQALQSRLKVWAVQLLDRHIERNWRVGPWCTVRHVHKPKLIDYYSTVLCPLWQPTKVKSHPV